LCCRLIGQTEKEMADEYKRLNDEYTRTKENSEAMAEQLKCTEQKLQETVLRLNEETSSRINTCKENDRLEDRYEMLRRNLKKTLRILNTSEQTVQDTRAELDEVVNMYRELQDKYVSEIHPSERGQNDDGDACPVAEVRADNKLSDDRRTEIERLSKENSKYVFSSWDIRKRFNV